MTFGFSCAIQVCADTGNLKGMYDGIKQAIGPMQLQIAPLKSATGDAIRDKSKQWNAGWSITLSSTQE